MKNKYNIKAEEVHPEDAIFKVKTFINELQRVQESYFQELSNSLNLTQNGEDWLFDYIYNASEEDKVEDFEHYLSLFKQKYINLVR